MNRWKRFRRNKYYVVWSSLQRDAGFVAARRKPRPVPGPKTRRMVSLFRLVVLHFVFLHFFFLFLLVVFVVALCFGAFFFIHRLVHLVLRFACRLVTFGNSHSR